MFVGYLSIVALALLGLTVGLQFWLGPTFKNQKAFRWTGVIAATVIALVLAGSGITRLGGEIATRSWPTVEGTISKARVVGERAIHPEITYSYNVNGQIYSSISIMRTPGFGNKRSRLETAEIIVSKYRGGMPIMVHYDPANPWISTLNVGISYGSTLETVLGAIILLGTIFIGIPSIRRAGRKPPPA